MLPSDVFGYIAFQACLVAAKGTVEGLDLEMRAQMCTNFLEGQKNAPAALVVTNVRPPVRVIECGSVDRIGSHLIVTDVFADDDSSLKQKYHLQLGIPFTAWNSIYSLEFYLQLGILGNDFGEF